MTNTQNWAEALNISPESLSEWSSGAPDGVPLLVWCLVQGYLPIDRYFEWAQNEFELPVLDSRYFSESEDLSVIREARGEDQWHPWIYPVSKFDDVTIVACVEIPLEQSDRVRYVLADPRAMHEAWSNAGDELSKSAIRASAEGEEPPPAPTVDAPIGISATVKPFVLNFDAPFETPAAPAATAQAAPPAPAPVVDEAPVIDDENTAPPVPVVAFKPAAKAAADAAASASKGSVVNGSEPHEQAMITEAFKRLGERFKGAFIVKINGDSAKVAHWDQNLKPNVKGITVALSHPTFLRIVMKTMMPYHGYLMNSPGHNELFQQLGLPEVPKCVTAVPVRQDENLWGIVVAIGNEENQKMDSLNYAQELVDRIFANLGEDQKAS